MNWNRVESLLEEALARPAEGRHEFVTGACNGDARLRAEVLELLEHVDPSRDFFDRLGATFAAPPGPEAAPPSMEGSRVGRYEVELRIGSGGMGEVYRALDTMLQRRVALKFVPVERTRDPAARERFRAEARAVAAIDHPNVSAVYEVGEDDGRVFIAMPLYEGSTLRSLLTEGGPLPLAKAATYARQVALGLAAAHDRGIVHRDVKPRNVIVLENDDTRLLDFGIATHAHHDELTEPHVFGTLAYMSPERIAGGSPEPSGDIWSLGVVLHELLTGEQPFSQHDRQALKEEIAKARPPSIRSSRPDASIAMEKLVQRCLLLSPEDRPDAAEVSETLARIASPSRRRTAWMAVGAAAVAAAALWMLAPHPWENRQGAAPGELAILRFPRPPASPGGAWFELSPDGDRVVIVGARAEPFRVVRLSDGEEVSISGTERARWPFFSPDGQWVGFVQGNSLGMAAVAGGDPVTIVESLPFGAVGAAWRTSETIVVASADRGLFEVTIVPDADGTVRRLSEPDHSLEESAHRVPHLLPGGRAALIEVFFAGRGIFPAAVDLESGRVTILSESGRSPRFAGGHVLYGHIGGLYAVPFDPVALREVGPHVRLPLEANHRGSYTDFDVQGSMLVHVPPIPRATDIVRVDMVGREEVLPLERDFALPRFSPDGRSLIGTSTTGAETRIWQVDLESRLMVRFSGDRGAFAPQWESDGRSILYHGASEDRREGTLVWRRQWPDTAAPRTVIPVSAGLVAVGPDADWLVYNDLSSGVLRARSRRTGGAFTLLDRVAATGAVSPDGRYLAYSSDLGDGEAVYLLALPGPGAAVRLSDGGGFQPRWSGDGGTVFYRDGRSVIALDLDLSTGPRVVRRRTLFTDKYELSARYDVHPSGEGFVMVRMRELEMRVEVVPDWTALLAQGEVRTAPSAAIPARR